MPPPLAPLTHLQGAFSVCRAYVSHATTLNDRRAATARTSAAQGVGFVLGPAIGTLLALRHFQLDLGTKLSVNSVPIISFGRTLQFTLCTIKLHIPFFCVLFL